MAQDLGLHRETPASVQTAQDLAIVECRRRVWATCVILDRWYGAALGVPVMIELLDCDVLIPSPYIVHLDSDPTSWPIELSFVALAEHLKLSILFGRVLKTIYSPTGLKFATDEQLEGILNDMKEWQDNLPHSLQFTGQDSSIAAGLLHIAHTALQFLFWRVFMRFQYVCPPHLTFRPTNSSWAKMQNWSTESIQWLDTHDEVLDTLFIFPYAATSCALIQYHSWAKRKDTHALEVLRMIKETAERWQATVKLDQMSIRRKTCETMTLLYETALKVVPNHSPSDDRRYRYLDRRKCRRPGCVYYALCCRGGASLFPHGGH
jgi:hypothetical protein